MKCWCNGIDGKKSLRGRCYLCHDGRPTCATPFCHSVAVEGQRHCDPCSAGQLFEDVGEVEEAQPTFVPMEQTLHEILQTL